MFPDDFENLEFIAEEPILIQDVAGERRTGRILLGLPVFYEGDEKWPKCWYCFFVLEGLHPPRMIAGASVLHSLLLSLKFIQDKLDDFIESGGAILNEDGSCFYLPHKIRIDISDQKLVEVSD
ncbi:MAG: hypothetical protein SFY67_05340 [Candidatus Melainabacteria bacterium]|nr:hypothetical protein [Candidatus Melainabacteria bacterium]